MKANTTSPSTNQVYGLQRVCAVWGISRYAIYARRRVRRVGKIPMKRGPKPKIPDDVILMNIRRDIHDSPFTGEGHKKIHARLRGRKAVIVGRERVLKLMRDNNLLSPYRTLKGGKKLHDGRITTDAPNDMWATDATKINTVQDGVVWFFGIIEHWNAECLGWRISKRGDRFIALDALSMAVKYQFGSLDQECAKGLSLRPDHGTQFTSKDYRNQMRYWGITPSFSYIREPETNGVVERFHRTLKEQVIYGRVYQTIEELEAVISPFIQNYNREWILEKLGYRSPLEARRDWEVAKAV